MRICARVPWIGKYFSYLLRIFLLSALTLEQWCLNLIRGRKPTTFQRTRRKYPRTVKSVLSFKRSNPLNDMKDNKPLLNFLRTLTERS